MSENQSQFTHKNIDKSRLLETSLSIFSSLSLISLLFGAFSFKSREKIKKRAIEKYGVLASELSGNTQGPFEAAHINHSRKSRDYDNPNQGILLTTAEHYDYHVNMAGKNGLTYHQNIWALIQLWGRMSDADKSTRQPPEYYDIL